MPRRVVGPPPRHPARNLGQKGYLAVALVLHAALGFLAYVVVAIGTYGANEDAGRAERGGDILEVRDISATVAVLLWLAGFAAIGWIWHRWAWAALLVPFPWIVGVLFVASIGLG